MEDYVYGLTLKIWNQKKAITTTHVNYFVGYFVINLRGMEAKNHF